MTEKNWQYLSDATSNLGVDIESVLQTAIDSEINLLIHARNWRVRWVPAHEGVSYTQSVVLKSDIFDDGPADLIFWSSYYGEVELWEFYINV